MIPPFAFLTVVVGLSWSVSGVDLPEADCYNSPYRSLDGLCNNVRRPAEGAAFTPYRRLVPFSTSRTGGIGGREVLDRLGQGLDSLEKPGGVVHGQVTALIGLWSELILRDLSHPTDTEEGLLNGASGFLDASNLYGVSEEDEATILATSTGKINIERCHECRSGSGLGGLYTLLYKEHNRHVDRLKELNSHWPPDRLYQEARRILVAQVQHVTYAEYLPLLLSQKDWRGDSQRHGFYGGYSSSNTGGTFLETALVPLQLLSTMVPHSLVSIGLFNETKFDIESLLVNTMSSSLGPALRPSLKSRHMNAIQLLDYSRDRGLARYTEVVKECTGRTPSDFSQIVDIPQETSSLLRSLYKKVGEVELLIGGLAEPPLLGSILGPSLSCVLVRQFSSLRNSDRFWYENDLPPVSFSKEQLSEIRKMTLSSLLCHNVQEIRNIQPKAFVLDDPYLNAVIPCDHQVDLDLAPWKEDETKRMDQDIVSLMTPDLIKEALNKAEEDLARRQRHQFVVYSDRGFVDPKSPLGTAAAFSKPNRMALSMANNSLLFEYASHEIISSVVAKQRRRRQLDGGDNVLNLDIPSNKDMLAELDLRELLRPAPMETECHEEEGPCDPSSPYRSFTGHCNNLDKPQLGRSLTTFARLLLSVYENGISSPRVTSVTGTPLPSPRLVSSMIHADISYLHGRYTLMVMQFAQFVDHDITFTPNHRGFFASIPDCRPCDSALNVHPECMPIPIPSGDPFYPQRNVSTGESMCLAFMRSLPGQQRLGAREQINQNSAFLDASQVYGEHACLARSLRGYGGRLNVTRHPSIGKDLLPVSPLHPECKAPSGYCFIAGDGRASEQPGLTALHTIFMREHNRLVDGLRTINPHWGDELLFQTGRKILVGSYQHILYNEFLPRLLGWNAINLYGLKLHSQDFYKGYSSTCNPNVVTEFASAAYRIGHSLLRPHIPRMDPSFSPVEPAILLRDTFFNPDIIYQSHIVDEIMRGLSSTPMESLDQFITGEITNHLFEDRRVPHSGMDLPALNIQRGRDHGIPPYNEYRALCNLKRASSWEDLSREIPQEVIARLRLIYPTVNDIDLFPGGLSERPLQGGLVGPTFACIIGLQFRQLRKCDRFWYERDDPTVRFTEPQLAEIRKATLSKLICDNMDIASDIQRSAFDLPSDFLNPRLSCHSLPSIDLSAWREVAHTGCQIAGRTVPIGQSAIPTPCTSCICTPEGAQCASLRVTDCARLVREAGREAALSDEVCAAQCGAYLSPPPLRRPRLRSSPPPTSLVPPPPLVRRRPFLRSSHPRPPSFLG